MIDLIAGLEDLRKDLTEEEDGMVLVLLDLAKLDAVCFRSLSGDPGAFMLPTYFGTNKP